MAEMLWHLSRGPGHQTVISGQTLRRLAELGKVNANDLIWRPGLRSWIPAQSLGLTAPSPPGERPSVSLRSRVPEIAANDWCRTARLHIRVYARAAYRYLKRVELVVEALFGQRQRHPMLAGMLAACVLVGTGTVIAMRGAADAQVSPRNSGSVQNNAEATAASCANTIAAERHGLLQGADANRRGPHFALSSSIVGLPLLDGERAVFDPATVLLSNSDPVPLPTRKPVAAKSVKVDIERTAVRRKAAAIQKRALARHPKALPFAYSPL
jgi:hypothetical protein